MITDICTPPLFLPTRERLLLSKIQIVHASSLTKPPLFVNDSFLFTNVPSFPTNTVIACLSGPSTVMSHNVQSPLYFLARSPDFIFSFPASVSYPCLLTCEFTAVRPSCTALLTPVLSINIIQITAIVLGCSSFRIV